MVTVHGLCQASGVNWDAPALPPNGDDLIIYHSIECLKKKDKYQHLPLEGPRMRFHVRYKPIWSKLQLQPGFLWKKSLTDWPLLEWPCVTKGLNLGRPMWHAKKNAKGFLRIMNAAEKGGSIYDFEPRTVRRTTIPGEWYSIATKMIPACCVRGDAQEFKYVGLFFANDEGEASKMRWFLLRPLFPFFLWWTEFGWEGFFREAHSVLLHERGRPPWCLKKYEKIPQVQRRSSYSQMVIKKTWSTGSFQVANNSK